MIQDPEIDEELIIQEISDGKKLVACLCADWCETCNKWKGDFFKISEETEFSAYCFVWLDIDEYPDFIIDIQLETLPTLLFQDKDNVIFFGSINSNPEYTRKLLSLNLPTRHNIDPFIYHKLSGHTDLLNKSVMPLIS